VEKGELKEAEKIGAAVTSTEFQAQIQGDSYLRKILVQGAHYVLGHRGPDTDLKRWDLRLAKRGGKRAKKKAVVAVARKLGISISRWRDANANEMGQASARWLSSSLAPRPRRKAAGWRHPTTRRHRRERGRLVREQGPVCAARRADQSVDQQLDLSGHCQSLSVLRLPGRRRPGGAGILLHGRALLPSRRGRDQCGYFLCGRQRQQRW
jgi:hypothetical protein